MTDAAPPPADSAAARAAAIAACRLCDVNGWIDVGDNEVARCTHTTAPTARSFDEPLRGGDRE
ncbi:hypothetical protein [Mycobacterium szulgai]|uniref:Uncharacterized protein n=1 Tax=Mycobacterium szulgai TaxID=1787 RepID=A0A1X2DM64_MYCSZ|nr:hypothetical protein [Mycobacterium szulgai]MCV7076712.1 hypothetical protein [Mycobacterium szulgai]ORW88789.1 hypothetical protein AWC27_13905 [Mycobacterium szulgai]